MIARILIATSMLLAVAVTSSAQTPATSFDRAVYVTCREAHAMAPEARKTLAAYLAEHAAQFRGVTIPNDDRGAQVAYLVRGGCTLAPDAYLFTVIDRAIQAERAKLPAR
jgi:hypothetical protein